MIDATNPKTFPIELREIVHTRLSEIPKIELDKIRKSTIAHEGDVTLALEKYLSPSFAYSMYQDELIPIFRQYEIMCFHATRVGSFDTIKSEGLVSDIEKYKCYLHDFLLTEKVAADRTQLAIKCIANEYNRKYGNNPHQICFFTNYCSLHDNDGYAAYDQFYETVGGELANWALEEKMPDVLSILRKKGHPAIVKFMIPFEKVAEYHQDCLIYPFVLAVAAEELWNYKYIIEADSSLIGDVPPTSILEIIPIEN